MENNGVKTGSGFLEPERIVAGFGLKHGDHVADFGAGHGYFTLALARAVGREGKIWAVDVQKAALDMVRSRAQHAHLLNIEYMQGDIEVPGGTGISDRFADFVFLGSMLFQAEDQPAVLHEVLRVLLPGGRLAMIEWDVAVPKLQTAVAEPVPADIVGRGTSETGDMPLNGGQHRERNGNLGSGTRGQGTTGTGSMRSTEGNLGSGTLGPPTAARVKKQDAKALAAGAGFELDREFSAGPHHYGLLFKKP